MSNHYVTRAPNALGVVTLAFAPVAARGFQLASAASAGGAAMAAQHGDRGRRTAVLGCVTDGHAV
jgi:hypothetical protein